jgi:hypothetical protein
LGCLVAQKRLRVSGLIFIEAPAWLKHTKKDAIAFLYNMFKGTPPLGFRHFQIQRP